MIHNLDIERRRNEPNLLNIIKTQEKLNFDEKSAGLQHKMKALYKVGINDASNEEKILREALTKIQEIRSIRNERRIQARNAGNKETIRRGTLMKMLSISAQTLPLFVSKPGEKVPPLCGAVPAEGSYVAKVVFFVVKPVLRLTDDFCLVARRHGGSSC